MDKQTVRAPVVVRVTGEHHISQARQAARAMAQAMDFNRVMTFYIATAVSELANNLFFHATCGGTITLAAIRRNDAVGLEVTAEDGGPGIPDVERAMQDGFTTNGGLGSGLPGVHRLMDEFEISSTVGVGTRIMARKWLLCK